MIGQLSYILDIRLFVFRRPVYYILLIIIANIG